MKKDKPDNKHLSLNQRTIIQTGIENRCTKTEIANLIGKDPTTIAKEIRRHRQFRARNMFNNPSICVYRKECGACFKKCDKYKEIKCLERDRSPGACNKCLKVNKCRLDKYFYSALKAQNDYEYDLVDSREGFNLTTLEVKRIANIMKPLLDNGQSIYQIKSYHKEITQSISTLYRYIISGVFNDFGINNFSLKEQVNRKKYSTKYKKRKEPANYEGHKYDDYIDFKNENPGINTVEMDLVMNSVSGPYIQTFMFDHVPFMFGVLKQVRTSEVMSDTLDELEEALGYEMYRVLLGLILTDRGCEFQIIKYFETNNKTGEFRTHMFYCDPYESSQKPHVENNHNYIRDIIPNGVDISNITQEDINLMFSHINSTPRKILNGKTPYEVFEFLYGSEVLDLLNIKEIKRDEVVLKPHLLKHIYK